MKRIIGCVLVGYLLLVAFAHLDDHQLEFYDEARRSINAYEMAMGESHWLVPTYAGEADWFGTKPPLLVWCQAFFIRLLGVDTLAIRLPAALASLALIGLLVYWARREWGSGFIGLLAAIIVYTSAEYVITHGARSGDYDAMLVLFLTTQVVCVHRWVTTGQDKFVWCLGVAVLLAGYTKGVAGGFLLPSLGLWMLWTPEGRRQLMRYPIYVSVGGAILAVAAYYFAREAVDPGYIRQVNEMEWGGRYFADRTAKSLGPRYYMEHLFNDKYFNVFFLIAPWSVFVAARKQRPLHPAYLSLFVAAIFLLIISLAEMKLFWYKSPALPLLGLLAAYVILHAARLVVRQTRQPWAGVMFLAYVFAYPIYHTVTLVLEPSKHMYADEEKIRYRSFFRDQAVRPPYVALSPEYNPVLRYQILGAQQRGEDVRMAYARNQMFPRARQAQSRIDTFSAGDRIVACHGETQRFVTDRYRADTLYQRGPCQLLRIDEKLLR